MRDPWTLRSEENWKLVELHAASQIRHGGLHMIPHVVMHCQVSVDGRIDWLPIDPGLFYESAARWKEDATLAGTDTLLAAAEMFGEEESDQGDTVEGNGGPLLAEG
jgi:hypothetical protein